MAEYRVDLRDIQFVLREQVGIDEIASFDEFTEYTADDFEFVIAEAAKFARDVVHPLQAVCEEHGATLTDGRVSLPKAYNEVYRAYCKAGWGGVSVSPELGGQGLPHTIGAVCMEIFIGACPSFTFVPGLARAAARVIEAVGTPEQVAMCCEKMFTGAWGGTMCLTEAHAGSAVGDIRTGAVKVEGTDYYHIAGTKTFISAGDQDVTENIIHLVLARTPGAPSGIKGLSLFIVPTQRMDGGANDVATTALEKKMGLHGSPTTSLSFGDEGDCRGWILGGEGEGIKHMFLMMNEARIAVGLQGAAIANFAYQLSLDYAKERVQGTDATQFKNADAERVAIIEHPDVRRMLLTMKAYAEGVRSLLLTTAGFADRAWHSTDEKKTRTYRHLLEVLTPICKAWGSYRAFEVADLGIMVHGGYGYIREYEVEGLLRDVKIAAIYEGTNGIQALDLLGRKVSRKGGIMFMTTVGWLNEFVGANKEHPTLAPLVARLETAKNTLARVTMGFGAAGMKGDLYWPILNASDYLEMFGDVVVGRLLLEQAVIAYEKLQGSPTEAERRYLEGKQQTAAFFINRLMRTEAIAAAIDTGDRSALEIDFG